MDNIKKIKALVFDIDGVLTNGMIIPIGETVNDYVRIVDAKDSFGARVAAVKGFVLGIISGGETDALRSRCRHMHVKEENIFLGVRGKLPTFRQFCTRNDLDPSEVAYFGDDIPDVPVLRACGFGVAPADAAQEARDAADYVAKHGGGRGCVREVVEMILKAQGKWVFEEENYNMYY